MQTISYDCRAKPIQTFCNIPKLAKHEHTKTFKILGQNESQFLLDDKPAFHFEHIWGEGTTGEIYDLFARPAIADLVRGRNTILFVTGRNKRYRNDILFGENKDTGLLALTINALFNSIGEHRAMKYYFQPMGSNSYRVQSEAQAMFERHQRDLLPKVSRNVLGNLTHTSILEKSILDQTSNVSGIDEDHVYTIFVSAMEIHSDQSNSTTTDLLKMFTEGLSQHPFDNPQTCVEVEFDDARKTRRKLFDTNKIPARETAARLYTIRLVQAKKSEQIETIVPSVSQLTFIDLPTGKNLDLKIIKDFIVPPKKRPAETINHLRDFLNQFPLQDEQRQFTPIKFLLCASASSRDADETLQDIRWLMSLQSHHYLVYLGREQNDQEQETHVTRDHDDHQHYSYRPPRPPPVQRADPTHSTPNFSQQVPHSTPLAQSTPRSVVQVPSSTTTFGSIETHRSRHSQARPASSSRAIRATRSDEFFSVINYSNTPSTALYNVNPMIPPRIPKRTPIKSSPNVEQQVPVLPNTGKSMSSIVHRRPPPPPPLSTQIENNTKRASRSHLKTNPVTNIQQRASSVLTSRSPRTKTKLPFIKEEHLLKRSSSADRLGRERWLHHITNSSSINQAIKLRTSLPNPLQLVSNHFNAMSKLLNATKYAIEHRDENKVQLFQGDVMATSKGGVKVVFTSMDQVTHTSLLPRPCDYILSGRC